MLNIQDLHVSVEGKNILNGIDLSLSGGEVHAIMGPNGSGKSTLAHFLSGRDGYQYESGTVQFLGEDLLSLNVEERAYKGIFLAMQYPIELPGVNNMSFLRDSLKSVQTARGQEVWDTVTFLKRIKATAKQLKLDEKLLKRSVNSGFSGGEKKRNEILQMALLEPKLAVLDETDSGLDIDSLKIVAQGVNALRSPDRAMLIVTHYQRLLDYIQPDYIHVLMDGKIVHSGDKSLALDLEQKGYQWLTQEQSHEQVN